MHALAHFYYGKLVHHGAPTGEPRILARSSQITDEHVKTLLESANLEPAPEHPDLAWGIVRTGPGMFMMIHAGMGSAGQRTQHAVVLPVAAARSLAGDFTRLLKVVQAPIPTFEMLGDEMAPIKLPDDAPRSHDEQIDDLLELMTYCRNNSRNIEALLATIVQGAPLIVRNAPPDVEARTRFVQGLLTMLPSSTRFGVTFTTFTDGTPPVNTQITFNESHATEAATIFDWADASLSGAVHQSDYSRFMGSQLRLDAGAVIQQTEALTPVAGWRYKAGDSLADALAYASYRSTIDNSLRSNLPVALADVSGILADDRTLDDELRRTYASHLVRLSLAMRDTDHITPLGAAIERDPQIADDVAAQFDQALKEGAGDAVFDILHALTTGDHSLKAAHWSQTLHAAAAAKLKTLVESENAAGVTRFFEQVQRIPDPYLMARVVPALISRAMPLLDQDDDMPPQILSIALTHLDDSTLQGLLRRDDFAPYLSQPVKQYMHTISEREKAPPALLTQAAAALGSHAEARSLMRLTQMAYSAKRMDLILNPPTLKALARAARDPDVTGYHTMLVDIVQIVEKRFMDRLDDDSVRAMFYILMACRRYDVLANSIIEQAKRYIGMERQEEYIALVQQTVSRAGLPPDKLTEMIETLRRHNIKDIPLVAVICGALQAGDYDRALESVANHALIQIHYNPRWLDVLPPGALTALLTFYTTHDIAAQVQQVAELVPVNAAAQSPKTGLKILNESYKQLTGYPVLQPTAFDMVRHYVRVADDKPARRAAEYFGKQLDKDAQRKLNFTASYSHIMGKLDPESLVDALHITANFLQDFIEIFSDGARRVNQSEFVELAQSLKYQFNYDENGNLGDMLMRLARAVFILGDTYISKHGTGNAARDKLIELRDEPVCALDMMFVTSGSVTNGRSLPWTLVPNAEQRLLRRTSPPDFLTHLQIANELLAGALAAFPVRRPMTWTVDDVADEIISLQDAYAELDIRALLRDIAAEYQRLADIIIGIVDQSDSSVLEDDSKLSRRIASQSHTPDSVFELWRLMQSVLA